MDRLQRRVGIKPPKNKNFQETLLFFARPTKTDRDGYVVKEEEPLAIWGTTCKVTVPQLKDLESLNKEWRFTMGLLRSGRHFVVSAMSLLTMDIRGEPLVLARVPPRRGLIDVIIEEYQNRPADDIQMRSLLYVCDDIPIRYPAIPHDSVESLWRSFNEFHHCEICTTRRKGDVYGSPWLMSCGECSQSTLLARHTCEEFGQRHAVRYHLRRPDVDDRWLTVEFQFGWTTVGPFGTHRVDDLKEPKMDMYVWTR
ncbi:hypothetical protein AAVH_15030 [Aphelenchoides avenae]|nr:hypothetical protein AAVH_15030 [Aphelenchus avenae]